jgi:putative addiction module component (TIGR02574 family)
MSSTMQDVLEAALRLPKDRRAELIDLLEESLDDGQGQLVSREWRAEIQRRWAEFEQGKVETYSWEEVKKSVNEELDRHA